VEVGQADRLLSKTVDMGRCDVRIPLEANIVPWSSVMMTITFGCFAEAGQTIVANATPMNINRLSSIPASNTVARNRFLLWRVILS
jgi:hypothetical protein